MPVRSPFSKTVPFSCEQEAYPSCFLPFSNRADLVRMLSKRSFQFQLEHGVTVAVSQRKARFRHEKSIPVFLMVE